MSTRFFQVEYQKNTNYFCFFIFHTIHMHIKTRLVTILYYFFTTSLLLLYYSFTGLLFFYWFFTGFEKRYCLIFCMFQCALHWSLKALSTKKTVSFDPFESEIRPRLVTILIYSYILLSFLYTRIYFYILFSNLKIPSPQNTTLFLPLSLP